MALSSIAGTALANWYLAYRNGGLPSGTVYNCLVSDLTVGDYLPGPRLKVVSIGAVAGGNSTFTVSRVGFTFTVTMPTASSVQIIR